MVAAVSERVFQTAVLAAAIGPADDTLSSQAALVVAAESSEPVYVTQSALIVAARGRVSDPHVRVWTFTLDNHDHYVLPLGNTKTLLYDTYAESWYNWGTEDSDLWQARTGCNWVAADKHATNYGSNVVVGDDTNGSLYFLNPDGEVDDDRIEGIDNPRPYLRAIQGQIVVKGYNAMPCYGVQLQGSIADVDDASYTDVTLSVSDDRGASYTDMGTISVTPDVTIARVHWRSLGSIRAPGRLFKVVDYGALTRIDSLDMEDGE